MPTLIQLRDEAWAASEAHHARIKKEWEIYHNEDYADTERVLRALEPRASRSLNPQIQKGILRLVSPFMSQASRMEVQPDKSEVQDDILMYTEDLQNWLQMHEEADNESESLKSSVLHNLVGGMAIRKQYFDTRTHIFRSEVVHPCSFAIDGGASRIDLSDAVTVCQRYYKDALYLTEHYDWYPKPETEARYRFETMRWGMPTHVMDEIWLRREIAEECEDFDQDLLDEEQDKQIFRAVLIDDEVVKLTATPYWYPDFPYACWRNFTSSLDEKKAQDMWGFGYGTLLLPNQKLLDEMIATLVAIARNMPTGQMVATKGALDPEQQYNLDGQLIELETGKNIDVDFQKLPVDQIPTVFAEMVQYMTQIMEEQMPSLNEVFTGQAAGANESGRAINSRQWAAFTQLSDNLERMDGFRRRCVIQRVIGIQQTAQRPLSSHLWRGSLDMPDYFPEEARTIGFDVVSADTASMPHSPLAKLQVLQTFAALGYVMPIDEALKFTGFDRGYGLKPDMFMDMTQMQPAAMQDVRDDGTRARVNEQMMAGAEAPLP